LFIYLWCHLGGFMYPSWQKFEVIKSSSIAQLSAPVF
jgi:hypothetical protein